MKLTVTANTILKTSPIQSAKLPESEKVSIALGTYEINGFEDEGNHLLVEFTDAIEERKKWYIFEEHVDLINLDPIPENTDKPEEKKGGKIVIPGKQFYLEDYIIPGGHFCWAEATKNGTRIPENKQVVDNIIAIAYKLEEVRDLFGEKAISVTSWYRDPVTNRKVGGASKSTHILGHGVDFNVVGLTPKQVQQQLESFWRGGMGYGRTFTHLDNRNYKARWNYGS